jgi:glutaminyl-peptide cyclotransferase
MMTKSRPRTSNQVRSRLFAAIGVCAMAVAAYAWTSAAKADDAQAPVAKADDAQAPAAQTGGAAEAAFDGQRAFEHLRRLVAIGPRPAGSVQIREARAYITRELSALGLTVQEQPFTAATPLGPVAMVNLIVRLNGRRPERVLVTGHYDTKLFKDQVFVGANDGASSAALLIELARVLSARPREYTQELIWFDGEEAVRRDWAGQDNTYGSRFYVQAARQAGAIGSIKAMVLVDMIGARDLIVRRDTLSTPWLTDLIWSTARQLGYGQVFLDDGFPVEDDHGPFLAAGVPSVDIIDLNDYPEWHKSTDDLSHVSAESLQIVGNVLVAALPKIQ